MAPWRKAIGAPMKTIQMSVIRTVTRPFCRLLDDEARDDLIEARKRCETSMAQANHIAKDVVTRSTARKMLLMDTSDPRSEWRNSE